MQHEMQAISNDAECMECTPKLSLSWLQLGTVLRVEERSCQADKAVVAPETRGFPAGKARCSLLGSYVNKIITTLREKGVTKPVRHP